MRFSRIHSITGLLIVVFLISVHVSLTSKPEVVTVDVNHAKKLLDSGSMYLDVRTAEEYKRGRISAKKVFNVPYWLFTPNGKTKNPKFLEEVSSLCKETDDLVVACKSGVRSFHATSELGAAGFKKVMSMEGGFDEWVNKGLPIEEERHLNEDL